MIFSVLAFMAVVVSICIKDRKKSLIVQSFNCFFEAIYDFLIFAYTGAVLSIINFIRTMFFIHKEQLNKRFYFYLLFIFEFIIIVNCIFTWQGTISLLPTFGSMIRVYCLWQSNMTLVRISGLTTGVLYGSYCFYYQAWFLVLGYIILFTISIVSIFVYDIKKRVIR